MGTINQFALTSDSLGQSSVLGFTMAQGGKGGWFELLMEYLASIPGIGPLVGPGFRGTYLTTGSPFFGTGEWSSSGVYNDVTSAKAFDKGLNGTNGSGYTLQIASGAKSKTWTKPIWWRPIVSFTVYWVDFDDTSGSGIVSGNWSYSIDGGARVAMGQTLAHNNGLKKFHVNSPIGSNVQFFCTQTDGSTAAGQCIMGIEPFYIDPTSSATSGIIGHNLSVSGSDLHSLCATTSGNRLAWFNSITLGTGSPITNAPNSGTIVFGINDVLLANKANYATDLTTIFTAASAHGPVGFIKSYEVNTSTYPGSVGNTQADYRAQMATTGTSLGASLFDLYAKWLAQGVTGYQVAIDSGLLYADGLHQLQDGNTRMYLILRDWVRDTFFSSVPNAKPQFPVLAKKATPAYTAKKATPAYSARRPNEIILSR